MELSTALKKKKRRTRKCLDEMRKRSRLTTNKPSLQHDKRRITEVEVPSHRLITANRLTLNMFPKAICSETITRPLLEELRQKSSNNGEEFKEINKSPKVNCFDNCQSVDSNNSMPLFDLDENSVREYGSNTRPLMDSQSIQSPTHNSSVPAELMSREIATSNTTPSSETLDENHGPDLHEELMNNISLHLKTITSTINIKEDVLNSIKTDLHELFTKNKETEYRLPMLNHENSSQLKEINICSPKTPIVENPIDYIRLQQQFRLEECCPLSPSTPERECPGQVNLFDTPEYNYYPHRLN